MRYERTFHLQSCHFNNQEAYDGYWRYLDARADRAEHVEDLMYCIKNSHGHNFRVDVLVDGDDNKSGFLIEDERMSEVVMEWDNLNLSTHSDFAAPRLRATTETMAKLLVAKLMGIAQHPSIGIAVTVWENVDIKAAVNSWDKEG